MKCGEICGLYDKHTTIVNYTSGVINKLEALLTDDARGIIYDQHVFIVQATALFLIICVTYFCNLELVIKWNWTWHKSLTDLSLWFVLWPTRNYINELRR